MSIKLLSLPVNTVEINMYHSRFGSASDIWVIEETDNTLCSYVEEFE